MLTTTTTITDRRVTGNVYTQQESCEAYGTADLLYLNKRWLNSQ